MTKLPSHYRNWFAATAVVVLFARPASGQG